MCIFAPNSYLGENHCIMPCCSIVELNIIEEMSKANSSTGFDSSGEPCDYIDEKGTFWIYLGKRHGIDDWGGIPNGN